MLHASIRSRSLSFAGCIVRLLIRHKSVVARNTEVVPAISALIEEYRDAIDLHHLAFPTDWETLLTTQY